MKRTAIAAKTPVKWSFRDYAKPSYRRSENQCCRGRGSGHWRSCREENGTSQKRWFSQALNMCRSKAGCGVAHIEQYSPQRYIEKRILSRRLYGVDAELWACDAEFESGGLDLPVMARGGFWATGRVLL